MGIMKAILVQQSELPTVKGEYGTKDTAGEFRVKSKNRFVLDLGEKKDFDREAARRSAAVACQKMKALKYDAFALRLFGARFAEAVAEGIILGTYEFTKYKSKKKPGLKKVEVIGSKKVKKDFDRGVVLAESANLVKDLVNEPGNQKAPKVLAERMAKEARKHGIKVKILNKKQIAAKKMNSFLSVAQGSAKEPRLVVMEYRKGKPLALVGKGITFDTGGINLKPSGHIETMKNDMAGAATVFGTMVAAARLGIKKPLVGVTPLTENMPGAAASRPGDIVKASNGKTIEIMNTDAEGRLILADALAFVSKQKPKATVDLATLTGAVIYAIGHSMAGMFCNNDRMAKVLEKSGKETGEFVLRFPLLDEWRELVKSDIADVRNTGKQKGVAGSPMGAVFLENFVVGDWAHLDIAGTAWRDEPYGYYGKGPTGHGIRLLINFIESY